MGVDTRSASEATRFDDVTPILSVLDLGRSLEWYESKLGFTRAWTWGEPIELASVCREQVELNLGRRGTAGPPGPSQVYLRVSPIDTVWELALASGAEVNVPIADRPYGMRDFSLRDESGNRLDFGEPIRTPRPASTGAPRADALKVFVPAKDFALSQRFYRALGFQGNWESDGLAELELAGCRLLLQDFFVQEWAENFMLHVEVPDADAWARYARTVLDAEAFPGARVEGPRTEPWGYRVTYVYDPSGVLLRFSQPLSRPGGGL